MYSVLILAGNRVGKTLPLISVNGSYYRVPSANPKKPYDSIDRDNAILMTADPVNFPIICGMPVPKPMPNN